MSGQGSAIDGPRARRGPRRDRQHGRRHTAHKEQALPQNRPFLPQKRPNHRHFAPQIRRTKGVGYIMRTTVTLSAAALLLAATQVSAQTCTEPHYRWTEKTD